VCVDFEGRDGADKGGTIEAILVYAFFFGQRGLMAGVGLEGSKITRINSRSQISMRPSMT
jgi:lipid-binding SYLF domain-containing protein